MAEAGSTETSNGIKPTTQENMHKRAEDRRTQLSDIEEQIKGKGLEEIARLILAQRRLRERAEKWGGLDQLTGLQRRDQFTLSVKKRMNAVTQDPSLHGLILSEGDLDDFGAYNKRGGTAVGDRALAGVTNNLKERLRVSDLAGRWGGEELRFAMPYQRAKYTPEQQRFQAVEEVRQGMRYEMEEMPPVSTTLGTTEYIPGESFDDAFKRASDAVRIAKLLGKDRTVVARINERSQLTMHDLKANITYILEKQDGKEHLYTNTTDGVTEDAKHYTIEQNEQGKPYLHDVK